MLTHRRDKLSRVHVQVINRLQWPLSELIPGHQQKDLSGLQVKGLPASMRPRVTRHG
jgi:transposase